MEEQDKEINTTRSKKEKRTNGDTIPIPFFIQVIRNLEIELFGSREKGFGYPQRPTFLE